MEFKKMREEMINHFNEITKEADRLFMVDSDPDILINLYLNNFRDEDNQIYRERREHDCSCCKHFIKRMGNIVIIDKNNEIKSIWDFEPSSDIYKPSLKAMSDYIKSKKIKSIFFTSDRRIGNMESREKLDNGDIIKYNHFYLDIPEKYLAKNIILEKVTGQFNQYVEVFKRGLETITIESLDTVLELIYSNTLYKGDSWKEVLEKFLDYRKEYDIVENKDNWIWKKGTINGIVSKLRNTSIGTLLVNISEGMSLDIAVTKYEIIVAPENYQRSKPIFSKAQVKKAKATLTELGYINSLERRFAKVEDISINNILFADRETVKRCKDVFGEMMDDASSKKVQDFSKVQEINIETFIENILPNAKSIEVYFENKHKNNLCSLIAPVNEDSKSIFKWNNNFSWAYSGNLADSSIKQNVKNAGGKVNGDLRFSIQWNDGDHCNRDDLDAHCRWANQHIYFSKNSLPNGNAFLDVDIITPVRNKPAVENIVFNKKQKMEDDTYIFSVKCYSKHGGRDGFKAQLEVDNNIFDFAYNLPLNEKEEIKVAKVILKDNKFEVVSLLDSSVSTIKCWNIRTNNFIPVSVVTLSPNCWNNKAGNKHYMFMLKDCINDETPNSFYNEFLNNKLREHRKFLEALGNKMSLEDSENQLSGLGFASTKRNNLIVRVVSNNTKRLFNITF